MNDISAAFLINKNLQQRMIAAPAIAHAPKLSALGGNER